MEEKGKLTWLRGIKIERKTGEICFDQEQYTEELLTKEGLSNRNPLESLVTVN